MRVYLDDVRQPPMFDSLTGEKLNWIIVRSAPALLKLIDAGVVSYISFDHDLGDDEAGTGYTVAKYIEEKAHQGLLDPIDYQIHSANPVGANNIDKAMKSAWKVWEKEGK